MRRRPCPTGCRPSTCQCINHDFSYSRYTNNIVFFWRSPFQSWQEIFGFGRKFWISELCIGYFEILAAAGGNFDEFGRKMIKLFWIFEGKIENFLSETSKILPAALKTWKIGEIVYKNRREAAKFFGRKFLEENLAGDFLCSKKKPIPGIETLGSYLGYPTVEYTVQLFNGALEVCGQITAQRFVQSLTGPLLATPSRWTYPSLL